MYTRKPGVLTGVPTRYPTARVMFPFGGVIRTQDDIVQRMKTLLVVTVELAVVVAGFAAVSVLTTQPLWLSFAVAGVLFLAIGGITTAVRRSEPKPQLDPPPRAAFDIEGVSRLDMAGNVVVGGSLFKGRDVGHASFRENVTHFEAPAEHVNGEDGDDQSVRTT